jgi:predicted transcriptional regulator
MGKTVNLAADFEARLDAEAAWQRRSTHAVMQEVLQNYVERAEKRRRFEAEAEAALTHYKETGLHVTGDEMKAWLADVAAGKMRPRPKCHK